jgi:hypothetical protein
MAYNPYFNPYYQQPAPQFYGNNGAMPDTLSQMKGQYQTPMQTTPMSAPTPTNDMIWVQGEAGAKAYLVAPNNRVVLWDTETKTIYIKSADASGVPSMQILDFTERVHNGSQKPTEHACQCGDKFATKEEIKALQGKYDEIMSKLQALEDKPKAKTIKKGDVE